MDQLAVNDDLMVGTGQPQEDDLRTLAERGVRSVVDLRQEGEPNQALPPARERQATETAGMSYTHVPVPTDRLDHDMLARFHQAVSRLPKPVFVHCASGKRSGSLAFMHDAVSHGLNGREALERAEQAGVLYGSQEVREQMRTFVDQQSGGKPS
ncbi:MAG TPA: protein tyrosine phosphatase family protein [Rhodopila sp.]|nr:protein tyrosine phosphatase family protein [Rhodopila sp.]